MTHKVLVTGLGMVTPIGVNVPATWSALTEVPDTNLKRVRVPIELAYTAVTEALNDSGLWNGQTIDGVNPARVGVTVSVSKPLLGSELLPLLPSDATGALASAKDVVAEGWEKVGMRAHRRETPPSPQPSPAHDAGEGVGKKAQFVAPPEVINQALRQRFGIQGESRNVIAACATGAYAIAVGASWIEQGLCDVVLAGSVEPYPHPLWEAGFRNMGVLSQESVMRPFDRDRSGFVFGEGAGVVVLESEKHAKGRAAKMHACLSGWGLGADTHSAVVFNSNGRLIAQVIQKALDKAKIAPSQIRHVNAHGTATRVNDWIETQALQAAFGKSADRLMISATKASTGHLLGAAGSVEFILAVLALKRQFIPATRHLENLDPGCALDYTPQVGHVATFDHALSLSFGFGGPIGALVVSPQ